MAKRHIIYILSDQHNPLVMGNAGDPVIRTPALDELFHHGTSFSNCYCAAPLCVPSRSAILSGLLPSRTGVYNNMQALPTCNATFVNCLTDAGYETVLCGRMHFVGWDIWHGFQQHLVGDITPCFVGGDNEREIYGEFMRSSGQNLTSIRKSGAGHSAVLDYDQSVVDAACHVLAQRKADDPPLFLTIGFYGPHCPYIAPNELFGYYYKQLPDIPFMGHAEMEKMHPAIRKWYENRKIGEVTREDVKRIRAAYYALVEVMDRHIARIVDTIGRTIGWDDTLLVYTSDHGDNIGEHNMFWKTNFYEGAARIPMVFYDKGRIAEGRVVTSPVSLMDLAPTFIHVGEAPKLPAMDGRDLHDVLYKGEHADAERYVISMCSDIKGDNPSAMIRQGVYKLVEYAGYSSPLLFDVEKDPKELHDLGTDRAYQGIVRRMMAILHEYWNPVEETERLRQAKIHFTLMKDWYDRVNFPLVGEWRGDPARNYLID
ncbi:MAG: sulfatase-like hydrolase/transferase [Sphaerochaetaceae bacterium]|nr:sulfatase-like hydrolase/transferase [Spirochaetales bacterium]MDY5498498.1 sulfatase-like hydrolase/transferase [Sphaerochaetaceae bacterium]